MTTGTGADPDGTGADDPHGDDGWSDDGWPEDGATAEDRSAEGWSADPRVRAGADHLQRAAREAIAAGRALLDVAEEVVEDPRAARDLLGLVASAGELLGRAARPQGPSSRPGGPGGGAAPPDDHPGDDDPDDDPPVQRIPVS